MEFNIAFCQRTAAAGYRGSLLRIVSRPLFRMHERPASDLKRLGDPAFALLLIGGKDHSGEIPKVLPCVIEVHNLDGLREVLRGQVPNPNRTVADETKKDVRGRPVRDEASTPYTGALEAAEEFGQRLYAEVHRRGGSPCPAHGDHARLGGNKKRNPAIQHNYVAHPYPLHFLTGMAIARGKVTPW
jgi:hypothetical protein